MKHWTASEELEELTRLARGELSGADFERRNGLPVGGGGEYASRLLERAANERDSRWLTLSLAAAAKFRAISKQNCEVLCELARGSWHKEHETIVSILCDASECSGRAELFFELASRRFEYLSYDLTFALARRCIWCLGKLGTKEALESITQLLGSDNRVVRRHAFEQLTHLGEEANDPEMREAANQRRDAQVVSLLASGNSVSELIDKLSVLGEYVYWYGATSKRQVEDLELALGVELPDAQREFLMLTGGGGGQFGSFLGIAPAGVDEMQEDETLHVTRTLRESHGLPNTLVPVISRSADHWLCIETSREGMGEHFSVVDYSTADRTIVGVVASSFSELLRQYTLMHISDPLEMSLFVTTDLSEPEVMDTILETADGVMLDGLVDADTYSIRLRPYCEQLSGGVSVTDTNRLKLRVAIETSVLPAAELMAEAVQLAARLRANGCVVCAESSWPAFLPNILSPRAPGLSSVPSAM